MATVITLKPTSASGPNWSNTSAIYDNSTSTGAEVSATYNNYDSRVLTCNFDTSSIPSNATIISAILEVKYSQSTSTSSRLYTPYFDINGDSSKRVLSQQLTSVSMYEEAVDITSHMSSLKWITITPYRSGISGENVLTIFDMKITVNYQVPLETKNIYLGGTKIAKITLGSTEIKKVFLGEVLLYGENSPSGTWLVSAVSNASYGFALNSNGYYESLNKGVDSSVALCKVTINNPGNKNVYFDCIKSSEAKYDNALLGKVGQVLSNKSEDDSEYFYSFKNDGGTVSTTISYGAVSGDIYVKFYKDFMSAEGSDSFQFKVRIE